MRCIAVLVMLACVPAWGDAAPASTSNTQKILARVSDRHNITTGTGVLVVEGILYDIVLENEELVLRPVDSADEEILRVPVPTVLLQGIASVPEPQSAGRAPKPIPALWGEAGSQGVSSYEIADSWSAVEFMLDTVPELVVPQRNQSVPCVSFDGNNYLVVWEDWRGGGDIYCTRIAPDGTVLDPGGVAVAAVAGYQLAPAVAFNGNEYIVVWEDWRRGYYADVYGARISTSGVVLDPGGRPISTARDDQWRPAIEHGSTQCLVVWEDFRSGSGFDIYGTRLGPGLSILDPSGIAITTSVGYDEAPQLTERSGEWLVTWSRWSEGFSLSDVYAARVTADGTVLDTNGFVVTAASGIQASPRVGSDGTSYLVAWTDQRDGAPDVYACRLDRAGVRLDQSDILISQAAKGQWVTGVRHNGTDFVVVWDDGRTGSDVYAARVSGGGTVREPDGIAVCTAAGVQYMSALNSDGKHSLVVWSDKRNGGNSVVYGARLAESGAVLDVDGSRLSGATNKQQFPSVARGGSGYLAVWEDARNGDVDIYGCRYRADGLLLDEIPFLVARGDSDQVQPAVAFDGTNYLVVWTDYCGSEPPDIRGCRVSTSGVVLDPDGLEVAVTAGEQSSPALASDGVNYLVVWQDDRSCNNWDDIYCVRVSSSGAVLDNSHIPVSATFLWQIAPAVASSGSEYLVVWEDHRPGVQGDIYGCRVGSDGVVLDTFGVAISTHPSAQFAPDVASNGTSYLVVWADERNGHSDIYGSRFSRGALDPEGRRIYSSWYDQTAPSLCWDDETYNAAWNSALGSARGVMVGRLGASVTLTGLYTIGQQFCSEVEPDLAGAGGEITAVYQRWTSDHEGRSYSQYRVWASCYDEPNVEPGWWRLPDVPAAWRQVKHGGGLTALNDKVYVMVGNRTFEVYEYDIWARKWSRLPDVPLGASGRPVGTGACMTNDGQSVYLLKGNRTYEFYRYDPVTGIWSELPQPVLRKKAKGASMAFDGKRTVYMIPGERTREWKIFDVADEVWTSPDPESLPTTGWKHGSFLVVAGEKLYGLRCGHRTNELYELNTGERAKVWTRLEGMPVYSRRLRRKKKAKDGAGGAWNGHRIYALKGGKTNEFYAFDPSAGTWEEMLELGQPWGEPRRPVRQGGGLTYSPVAGGFFALVGNRTNEFWFYMPGGKEKTDSRSHVAVDTPLQRQPRVVISPNPTPGRAVIQWDGAGSGTGEATFYDATGRLAFRTQTERGICELPAGVLGPGIYLVKVRDETQSAQAKIVVTE